jgi:predicted DNA-binding mobile mystery protein A
MSPEQARLARKNLDRRLDPLRAATLLAPPGGWIKAVRQALGMSVEQFARRMGVAQSRASTIEKAELTGATTIRTIRQAAEAMGCTFVYAVVPTSTLDELVRQQAVRKADAELARLDHTMRLENQAMTRVDLEMERERLIEELLSGSPRRLWTEE